MAKRSAAMLLPSEHADANFDVEFVFPTSKEMGHPFLCDPKNGK